MNRRLPKTVLKSQSAQAPASGRVLRSQTKQAVPNKEELVGEAPGDAESSEKKKKVKPVVRKKQIKPALPTHTDSHPDSHPEELVSGSSAQAAKSRKQKVKPVVSKKRAKPAPPTHIDSLPEEILARIFQLLYWRDRVEYVEQVSKKWNALMWRSGWADYTRFSAEELERNEYIGEWKRLPFVSGVKK